MKTFVLSFATFLLMCVNLFPQHERLPMQSGEEKVMTNFSKPALMDSTTLDSISIAHMNTYHIPGLTALITKKDDGIIWKRNYGYANIDLQQPVEDSTLFIVGSVSKTIVATAIMQFWEADSFELDDNINDYLDDFQVIHPEYPNDTITFRMLMTHTSGVNDNYQVFYPLTVCGDSPVSLDSLLINYFTPGGTYYSRFINFNSWAPGTGYDYSNFGACLLAYFVEKFSGISFEQYCRENIFNPLGMGSATTSYLLAGLDTTTIATPYLWDNNQYIPYCHYGAPFYPIGLLRTTKIDLEHFLSAYMNWGQYNGNRILDSSTVDLMLTDQLGYPDPVFGDIQGLVWYQTHEVSNSMWPWGHEGTWNGCRTKMFFKQEEDWGVIYFMNLRPQDASVAVYLLDLLCGYAHLYGHIYALNTKVNKPYMEPAVDTLTIATNFSNMNQHNFSANAIFITTDSSYIDSIALYDDGLHGDKLAGDGLWGGFIHSINQEEFFNTGISTTDLENGAYLYTGEQTRFTTAGPVVLDSIDISYSAFGYYKAKPYLHNMGNTATITNAGVRVVCDDPWVTSISYPVLNLSDISPGATIKTNYNANVNVDSTFPGYFNFKVEMMSDNWVYWIDSIQVIVGVDEQALQPLVYNLEQNYPNPFNPSTTIKYQIPERSLVTLKIYDILGNDIATLVNGEKSLGNYEVEFNSSGLSTGVYFYQLRAGTFVKTKKMVLLK